MSRGSRYQVGRDYSGSSHLYDDFALNLGFSSRRIAWPGAEPWNDARASETLVILGAQYVISGEGYEPEIC